jgi:hypothetical protein
MGGAASSAIRLWNSGTARHRSQAELLFDLFQVTGGLLAATGALGLKFIGHS